LPILPGFIMEIHMKKCSLCKQEKDFTFFYLDKSRKSGHSNFSMLGLSHEH